MVFFIGESPTVYNLQRFLVFFVKRVDGVWIGYKMGKSDTYNLIQNTWYNYMSYQG